MSHLSGIILKLLKQRKRLLLNRFSSLATPHQIVKAWTATVTMLFFPGFLFLKRRSMCAQKQFSWTDPLFGIAKRPTQVCCANIRTKDYQTKSVGYWPIIMKYSLGSAWLWLVRKPNILRSGWPLAWTRGQREFSIPGILDKSQLHFFLLDHEKWFSKVSISSRNMRVTIFSLVLVSKYDNGLVIISISSR